MKNANEKLAILLLQAKDDKVLIVAGSKNTNIKAGDWIKNIAPIVGEVHFKKVASYDTLRQMLEMK